MKLGTNIQHVSEHCWKRFQGQRSKVKVRLNAIMGRHAFRWRGVCSSFVQLTVSSIAFDYQAGYRSVFFSVR